MGKVDGLKSAKKKHKKSKIVAAGAENPRFPGRPASLVPVGQTVDKRPSNTAKVPTNPKWIKEREAYRPQRILDIQDTPPFTGCWDGHWELILQTDQETGEQADVQKWVPPDSRRCAAKCRNGKNAGNRCLKLRELGTTVCKAHGGSLPMVRKAAQRRLGMAALPAVEHLLFIALEKKGVTDGDRLRALVEVLNRAGITGKETLVIELKPWQNMMQRLAGTDPKTTDLDEEEGVDYELPGHAFEALDE